MHPRPCYRTKMATATPRAACAALAVLMLLLAAAAAPGAAAAAAPRRALLQAPAGAPSGDYTFYLNMDQGGGDIKQMKGASIADLKVRAPNSAAPDDPRTRSTSNRE
jgi:hypothetical protein